MVQPSSIAILGYRATGKSTVARQLATRLAWKAVDLDAEVEQAAGCSIATLFETAGEEAFRQLEHEQLERWAVETQVVLSLGGGAILFARNQQLLAQRVFKIGLRATPETIWKRMQADLQTPEQRPPLTARGGFSEIEELLAQRTPVYEKFSDFSVDTEHRTVEEVVQVILDRICRPQGWLDCLAFPA